MCGGESLPTVVHTTYGDVQGFSVVTDKGTEANIFLGIPFATPPVGDLRFEKPVPPTRWIETYNASVFRDECEPFFLHPDLSDHSEDCLYLNVYAPHEKKASHPVMVIIHGGGFVFGSALAYRDYYDIADNFLSKGIVVVTIQYRLGVEGFASTGDAVLPGNLGLWDQVAALRFVKENIAGFGGDPNRITLFGFSAGSASVSALTVAPSGRDLFSQAIEMSGTALAQWAHNDYVADETRHLADALGCNATSSDDIKSCLKRSTSEEIRAAVLAIGPTTRTLHLVKFGPRIDGDFFPSVYEELVKTAPAKPTFAGFVEEEATLFTILNAAHGTLHLFGVPPEKQATFGEDDFVQLVNEVIVMERNFGNATAEVRKKVVDFYLSSDSIPKKDNVFYLRKYTQLCSDTLYNIPILREAHAKVQRHWPVHLYKHTYLHKILDLYQRFPDLFDAASHSHDHRFVFRGNNHVIRAIGFDFSSSADARVADFWVDSVAAFVKAE
ncbi:GES-1 protein [Aphelenchoides avenae]|nr:GES-1 protein [Aphelenchus avenae]